MKIINQFLKEVREFGKKDSVKAIVLCPCEHILLLRRQNDQGGAGNWDLPGGCIEEGEKETDALTREVFEETNLKVSNIKKLKDVKFVIPEKGINSVMHIYKCNTDNTNVKLKPADWAGADGKAEHNEYKWITSKDELKNLPMLDSLKSIVMSNLK